MTKEKHIFFNWYNSYALRQADKKNICVFFEEKMLTSQALIEST